MKAVIQWIVIVALLALYGAALFAVLHPHVSPEYKAYFIDRTTSDFNSPSYHATPEEGMQFSKTGLPDWVASTHGLSTRDPGGRWTDADLGPTAGLTFARAFYGNVCLDFSAQAVPWLDGRSVGVRLGKQESTVQVHAAGPSDYRLQFTDLDGADRLDFLLPPSLPLVAEQSPGSNDTRRLGINLSNLRVLSGDCRGEDKKHGDAH